VWMTWQAISARPYIPAILPRMPTLRAVLLAQNAFTGDIPDALLENLPRLMYLFLVRPGVIPSTPSCVGAPPNTCHVSYTIRLYCKFND